MDAYENCVRSGVGFAQQMPLSYIEQKSPCLFSRMQSVTNKKDSQNYEKTYLR